MGWVWEAWGHSLELVGTFVTGVGLFIAWRRASGRRLEAVRDALQRLLARMGAAPGDVVVHLGAANLTVVVGTPARGVVTRGFDNSKPTQDQIDELVAEAKDHRADIEHLYSETDKLRTELADTSTKFLTKEDFEAAVATELDEFKAGQDINAFQDLNVALLGLLITFVGIAFGFLA